MPHVTTGPLLLFLLLLLVLLIPPATSMEQQRIAFPDLDRATRQDYVDRLERILYTNIRPWWLNNTVDTLHGGFNINHDLAGTFLGPADKMVVTQCRETWFFARLALFQQQQQQQQQDQQQQQQQATGGKQQQETDTQEVEEDRRLARHGFDFLRDRMWDSGAGGFWWLVANDGTPRSAGAEGFKDLYGQAFGLYALSYYHRATGDAAALDLAKRLFGLMHDHCHDAAYGGFHEAPRNDWTVDPLAFAGAIQRPTPKTINTHLHLLEAVAAFHAALLQEESGGDGGIGSKAEAGNDVAGLVGRVEMLLQELLELVTARVIVEPQGTLFEFYDAAWGFAPLPPTSAFHGSYPRSRSNNSGDSNGVGGKDEKDKGNKEEGAGTNAVVFGHVNELAWLVVDTCEGLGIDPQTQYGDVLKRLWAYSTTYGWDGQQGAFNNKQSIGGAGDPATREGLIPDDKVWWVQCESLTAAVKLNRALGLPTLDVFDRLLTFLDTIMVDWARGEWYEQVKDGKPQGAKAEPWKGPYHNGRAIMLCLEELRRGL